MPIYLSYDGLQFLEGHKGAINSLVFFDAYTLISGGDDRCVKVWDLNGDTPTITLRDSRWGQVVALNLMPAWSQCETTLLVVGTASGFMSLFPYNKRKQNFNKESSSTFVIFQENDAIEVQALDTINHRLIVLSHSGKVKLYKFDDGCNMTEVWYNSIETLAHSIAFRGSANQEIWIHSLYHGERRRFDASNGALLETTQLNSAIASSTYSSDGRSLVVFNLTSRLYNLFSPPENPKPTVVYNVSASNRMIKNAAFGEENCVIVCGAENGSVMVFDVTTGNLLQRLEHDDSESNMYAVTTFSTEDAHYVASGGSLVPSAICVWSKPTAAKHAEKERRRAAQVRREQEAETARKQQAREAELLKQVKEREEMLQQQKQKDEQFRNTVSFFVVLIIGVLVYTYLDAIKATIHSATSGPKSEPYIDQTSSQQAHDTIVDSDIRAYIAELHQRHEQQFDLITKGATPNELTITEGNGATPNERVEP
ncbi:WD40 repeat-like protein [Dendrothele bispora CBS 962.96]|uniref:WD40 repeat-like protein n=1 Tax=Dendrothele bispora (strain CBS 962.96) TaxID=1314807 RepID=A0A4S8MTW8_DENBC|nr:WD40 repeat-like protein [Dendrothele bispora CBS 962.96]